VIRWFFIVSLLQIVAFWKILGRMGLPPWLSILASAPLLNLVVLYWIAVTPWPRESGWNTPRAGGDGSGDAKF
jgi:hypothetical protein